MREKKVNIMEKKSKLPDSALLRKTKYAVNDSLLESMKTEYAKSLFNMECPECKKTIQVPIGTSNCPNCGNGIELFLDFDF